MRKFLILTILSLLFFFSVAWSAQEGLFNDNFESYNLGDLNGQGDWSGSTQYDVVDSKFYEGSKSLFIADTSDSFQITKTASSTQYGIQSVFVYLSDSQDTGAQRFFYLIGNQYEVHLTNYGFRENSGKWECYLQNMVDPYTMVVIDDDVSTNEWHSLEVEFDQSICEYRIRLDIGDWSDWYSMNDYCNNEGCTGIHRLTIYNKEVATWYDTLNGGMETNLSLIITNPENATTTNSSFTMDLTYNLIGENYQKAMIIFESWHASSTCPVYGTDDWQTEYNNNWFYYQSGPYFSPELTATSSEATTTIAVSLLNENFYNCVRCYFINEDLGTMSEEQCPDYTLTIAGYISQSQPLPSMSWENYYNKNTNIKFATSTEIFNTITDVFQNLYLKLTDYLTDFIVLFDNTEAEAKGTEFGQKIPLARGYLAPINDFFNGFPISELFIFAISINLIMIFFRITKAILQLIRG